MARNKQIKLYNCDGYARRSGNTEPDGSGATFTEDECSEEAMECDQCGRRIWRGWTCMDGGEFYCYHHVTAVEDLRSVLKTNKGTANHRYGNVSVSTVEGGYEITYREGFGYDVTITKSLAASFAAVLRDLHAHHYDASFGWGA